MYCIPALYTLDYDSYIKLKKTAGIRPKALNKAGMHTAQVSDVQPHIQTSHTQAAKVLQSRHVGRIMTEESDGEREGGDTKTEQAIIRAKKRA